MPNDVKLQSVEGKPVDENLRPILVGGKSTAIETAQHGNGARVNGDLTVTGNINGNPISRTPSGIINVTSDDDINLIADESINLEASSDLYIKSGDDISLQAVDNITIDAADTLTIDNDGTFIMKKDGTEFSAANSAYAGMILGYTHIFNDSDTNGEYQQVTTAWESLLWDTDKYALVTFVVPPSNKVEIKVHLPYCNLSGNLFYLGLATDSSATSLSTIYQNRAWDVDETDIIGINYSWVVDGSTHSWAAGETKTLYIMAYAGGITRIYMGGTNSGYYGGVKVQAIALPATIGNGEEP